MIKVIFVFFITTLVSACAQLAVQVAQEVVIGGTQKAVMISESNKKMKMEEERKKQEKEKEKERTP